jgi:hypothetical protein
VSTEKLSWCRGSMGIVALDFWLCNPLTPYMQRKQQVGECWVCVIFFTTNPGHWVRVLDVVGSYMYIVL